MNTIAPSEAPTRPAVVNRLKISKKSEARQLHSGAPLIDVLPRLRKRTPPPAPAGSFRRVYQTNEAGARDYNINDKPNYVTGDGDVIYALRPGALDFKAIPSRTGFSS